MGLRDKINENPGVVTAITIGLVVVLLLFMAWNFFGSADGVADPDEVWYLTPDGQWTAGSEVDFTEPGPDGQPRVRVYVYQTADGQEIAGYYERMHPQALQQLQSMQANNAAAGMATTNLMMNGREVRLPDQENWIPAMSSDGQGVQQGPKGPDGARLKRVRP